MPTSFTGGCVCGAIRYECNAEPVTMFNCRCRDCQRTTGSAFTPVVYVPVKAFKITKGSPRYYSTTSEMVGHNKRGVRGPNVYSRFVGSAGSELPSFEKYPPSA